MDRDGAYERPPMNKQLLEHDHDNSTVRQRGCGQLNQIFK